MFKVEITIEKETPRVMNLVIHDVSDDKELLS
jgi:hypothetical protein